LTEPEKKEEEKKLNPLKTRVMCKDCPSYYDPCLSGGAGDKSAHWVVIGRSPSGFSIGANQPFCGQDGRLFKKLLKRVIESSPSLETNPREHVLGALKIYYTYLALSGIGKVGKDHIKACTPNLWRELSCVLGINNREPVIIALGADILRALNIKVGKIDDVMGRFLTTTMPTPAGPRTFQVLPLMTMADLGRRQGSSGVIETLLHRAANLALYGDIVGKVVTSTTVVPTVTYTYPKTIEEVIALVDMILAYSGSPTISPNNWALGLDTETNTLDMYKPDAKVLMLSVAWDTEKASVIMLDHPLTPYDPKLAWEQVRRLLSCPKPKVWQNWKFDLQGLELTFGCRVNNVLWDTMCSEHWIDEDKKGLYGLKKLTPMYVPLRTGYDMELQGMLHEQVGQQTEKEKKAGSKKAKKKEKDFSTIPLDTILLYAATDSDVDRQIMRKQWTICKDSGKIEDARNVMNKLYLPASRTLGRMEYHGLKVNMSYLEELDTNICKLRDEKLEELRRDYNPTINYAAPGQISKLMAELQFVTLPGREFGKTDKETLQRYATLYGNESRRGKFALNLLAFRSANDAKTKFIKKIRDYVKPDDGCIHCNFHLTGTATGRLSASNPNLQNLPKRVCRQIYKDQQKIEHIIVPGFNAKRLFIPKKPGNVLVNVDIKGAELRVYTAYSHDEKMIDALMRGIDIHSLVTEKAYGIPYDEIMAKKENDPDIADKRRRGKTVVFGTFFQAGAGKIAQQIESTREEGQRLIDILYSMFPKLAEYVENVREEVRASKYVKTFFGRYRRFKMAGMGNSYFESACREAINFKIQSTASDLLLSQMCEIDEHIAEIDGELLITVHDSILLELPEKNIDKVKPFMTHWITERVKEKYPWLPIPFLYDCEAGPSYGELKEVH
jgi:DNA polymerase I-like protein with 3'-5' exonuclease and polymerase domains/uracil-DNA glycosylase